MFGGVLVSAIVQNAMEVGKLVTSGLSHEAHCAFVLCFMLFVLFLMIIPNPLPRGTLCCASSYTDEDPGTMARRGCMKYRIPGE